MDGWDFKAYVLGILFYRFISENLVAYINAEERRAGTHTPSAVAKAPPRLRKKINTR